MKYFEWLEKKFPGKYCYVGFWRAPDSRLEIQIQVGDYCMSMPMKHIGKITESKITEEMIDREFGYMLEVIKAKLDAVNETQNQGSRAVFAENYSDHLCDAQDCLNELPRGAK